MATPALDPYTSAMCLSRMTERLVQDRETKRASLAAAVGGLYDTLARDGQAPRGIDKSAFVTSYVEDPARLCRLIGDMSADLSKSASHIDALQKNASSLGTPSGAPTSAPVDQAELNSQQFLQEWGTGAR